MKIKKIVLGSTSPIKLEALTEAAVFCAYVLEEKISLRVMSGVNIQPYGLDETLAGARNRARAAKEMHKAEPDSRHSCYIGIESGLICPTDAHGQVLTALDMAVIVLILPDGREITATSPGFEIPREDLLTVTEIGFKCTTVGRAVAQRMGGGDPADPHSTLSKGQTSRKDLLVEGLKAAFAKI